MRGRARARGDRGSTSVVELSFGFLWVVAAAVVVLTLASWAERHGAARTAADEAARAVVTADSWAQGSRRAQDAVDEVAANYGLQPGDLTLQLSGRLARGATVTATVTMTVDAVSLPMGIDVGAMTYSVSHSEPVDQYRSL